MIELQQKLLVDKVRNKAFFDALKKVIRPGKSAVSDLGAGTGFLSFIAHKLGARDFFLYEYESDLSQLSIKLAEANGIDNCSFFNQHSLDVKRPAKTDIVISETLGNFAAEEHIIETMRDAKRFLKPGGVLMPQKITQWIAPVIKPRVFDEINVWESVGYGLDFKAARSAALQNMYVYKIHAHELLGKGAMGQTWDRIELSKNPSSMRHGTVVWQLATDERMYGFSLWWNAELVPGIELSTSPMKPATHWDQIFLPVLAPLAVKKGDTLSIEITSDSRCEVGLTVQWKVLVRRHGKNIAEMVLDTRKGLS